MVFAGAEEPGPEFHRRDRHAALERRNSAAVAVVGRRRVRKRGLSTGYGTSGKERGRCHPFRRAASPVAEWRVGSGERIGYLPVRADWSSGGAERRLYVLAVIRDRVPVARGNGGRQGRGRAGESGSGRGCAHP